MNKCHTPIGWHNNTVPALNETNLNYMDGCIDTIDDRVVAMDTSKLEASDVASTIKGVQLNEVTGVFTFTRYDDSTFTLDTLLEKVIVNFGFDQNTQELVIYLEDGTEKRVSLSAFIQETEFTDSTTIGFTVTNHVVTATVKGNSIGDAQMQTGYLTDCQSAKSGAELAANTSNTNRLKAEGWAVGTHDGTSVPSTDESYENNAKYYADECATDAQYAHDAIDTINRALQVATFTVNTTTGNLEYNSDTAFVFTINETTGNLEWEVQAA